MNMRCILRWHCSANLDSRSLGILRCDRCFFLIAWLAGFVILRDWVDGRAEPGSSPGRGRTFHKQAGRQQ
jgi:hypothetical protein